MRHLLESEGVPRPMIWIESRSMNTHENAAYSAEILREHGAVRVVLVVEASSMPRASRSFRKAGIMVIPSPVRFTQLSWEWSDWLPGWPAIKSNGETLHEFGGLLWYKLRGWI